MKKKKSGTGTLIWSVIMSAPGPLVVGLGLLAGRSSTQIADFARGSAELLAIIMSFVVYQLTTQNGASDIGKTIQSVRRRYDVSCRYHHGGACADGHQ